MKLTEIALDKIGMKRTESGEAYTSGNLLWLHGSSIQGNLKIEYFRNSNKNARLYSLILGDEEIPFAKVEGIQKFLFNKNKINIEILPCMIPDAHSALMSYLRTRLILYKEYDKKGRKYISRNIDEIKLIQEKLINLFEKSELESKVKGVYF